MRKVPAISYGGSRILIVGEAPGEEEEKKGEPFVGVAGRELDSWLNEAGIKKTECYITNVCKYRPPGNDISKWVTTKKKLAKEEGYELVNGRYIHPLVLEGLSELREEILLQRPAVIIGLGNTPLWALQGVWGITSWRGSELIYEGIPFIPILHPAAVLRQWAWRTQALCDLRLRVVRRLLYGFNVPEFDFWISPSIEQIESYINILEDEVSVDTETCSEKIVSIALSDSPYSGICIPFQDERGYLWTAKEQKHIEHLLRKKLEHDSTQIIGQNFAYDQQYLEVCFNIHCRAWHDTLIAESVLFPGNERGLGYLSSIYCEWHCFWKDDAKDWSKIRDAAAFQSLFGYNCRDSAPTFEIAQAQQRLLINTHLGPQFRDRMDYGENVYRMMRHGVIRDKDATKTIAAEVDATLLDHQLFVELKAGHEVNIASPAQVKKLFYTELGCSKPKSSDSVDAEAMGNIAKKYPKLAGLANTVSEIRSLSSLRSNFIQAKLDKDSMLRSSYMATGTETFRLTSSKNAFGRGANLQNITSGKSHTGRPLPNLRQCIVPKEGYTIFDCDLKGADLEVVAWEAGDEDLKAKFRAGVDLHIENAKELFQTANPTPEQRQFAKTFVHLTNYGGKARTCAIKCGCTVAVAEASQKRWFKAHSGIVRWQNYVEAQLLGTRTIYNKFGYRRVYFDRLEGLLPEGLAWIPQSTIALVISYIHKEFDKLEHVEVLLQGHDSLTGQYPTELENLILPQLETAGRIVVPYADPLIIPLELKTSTISWGDCQKRNWNCDVWF